MKKYYTRACNFHYGHVSKQLVKKKISLPLCGNNNISFDKVEIFFRNKKSTSSKLIDLKKITYLPVHIKKKVLSDIKKITSKRKTFNNTLIMGILNMTPDSFSDGGKFNSSSKAFKQIDFMIKSGAEIIDVGGESTRPGSKIIDFNEERKRIEPILKAIKNTFKIPISIDTYKPEIMKLGIDLGVEMINDIFALRKSGSIEAVANSNVILSLMHMQGTPQDMQNNPSYIDVVDEVIEFLNSRVTSCEESGIDRSRIVIDPGFGFGKTHENNLKLFQSLDKFKTLSVPILAGVSRKSMIRNIIGNQENDIIQASAIMAALSVLKGAKIVRVHDVKETKVALEILQTKDN